MARQIWLLRHGDAEPHGTRRDEQRRLTPRGEEQARAAGRAISVLGDGFDAVLTSPRVRALDTARIAATAWGEEPDVLPALSSGFGARGALDVLQASGGERILLVGHEPDLSNTVAELTGARIDLKKGGLAVVRLDGGACELVVLLRPRELSAIAGEPVSRASGGGAEVQRLDSSTDSTVAGSVDATIDADSPEAEATTDSAAKR